jgi:hypothetical protein
MRYTDAEDPPPSWPASSTRCAAPHRLQRLPPLERLLDGRRRPALRVRVEPAPRARTRGDGRAAARRRHPHAGERQAGAADEPPRPRGARGRGRLRAPPTTTPPPRRRPYRARFWGGDAGYLDFTHPVGYAWWRDRVRERILDVGIDATWNDNNEFRIEDDAARCAAGEAGDLRPTLTLLMNHASRAAQRDAHPDRRDYQITRSGGLGMPSATRRPGRATTARAGTRSRTTCRWACRCRCRLGEPRPRRRRLRRPRARRRAARALDRGRHHPAALQHPLLERRRQRHRAVEPPRGAARGAPAHGAAHRAGALPRDADVGRRARRRAADAAARVRLPGLAAGLARELRAPARRRAAGGAGAGAGATRAPRPAAARPLARARHRPRARGRRLGRPRRAAGSAGVAAARGPRAAARRRRPRGRRGRARVARGGARRGAAADPLALLPRRRRRRPRPPGVGGRPVARLRARRGRSLRARGGGGAALRRGCGCGGDSGCGSAGTRRGCRAATRAGGLGATLDAAPLESR